jgi:hypothetical protein
MIAVRRYAEFRADFPDDHIWGEADEVIQTGGKAAAEAIAEMLASFGCVIEEIEDNVGHCWECRFTYEGLLLWFHVVNLDPCIFVLKEPLRAQRNSFLYPHVLLKLNDCLRRDSRFHDLAWYAYDDRRVGEEAFQLPVEGDILPESNIRPVLSATGVKRSFFSKLLAPLKSRSDLS